LKEGGVKEMLSLNIVISDTYFPQSSMNSMIQPTLSLEEGSNGLDILFSTISPFSDADPIMRGLRDGTLSWAEAAELEEAEAAISTSTTSPPYPTPNVSVWPPSPPRQSRVTFACPGAPKKAISIKASYPQGKVVKTLIVRNLPRSADDLDVLLRNTFEPYGVVRDIYIPKNMDVSSPYFGTIKGFALVKFAELGDAATAASASPLRIGRNNLSVEFAKEDR
jgi:hypothetical protein